MNTINLTFVASKQWLDIPLLIETEMQTLFQCIKLHLQTGFNLLSFLSARVDIAGTWSDTPPICYEHGGSVITAGVKIDSKVKTSDENRAV